MTLDEILGQLGCKSIEATKARFLEDREFYCDLTTEALNDPGFETLGRQLMEKDTQAAFDTAHMLKGVVSNCGLDVLFDRIVELVEPLRTGHPDYAAMEVNYRRVLDRRDADRAVLTKNS